MTNNKPLSPLNATVTTATVEIRTLTIDRRQVTLATFRQVPERYILDDDGSLQGAVWGWVNYCPGAQCCSYARTHPMPRRSARRAWHPFVDAEPTPHSHLLWQDGASLYRCALADDWALYGWVPPDALTDQRRRIERNLSASKALLDAADQLYIAT